MADHLHYLPAALRHRGEEPEVSLAIGSGDSDRITSPLTQIFRAQYRQLLRFCRMRVHNDADTEDIVQGVPYREAGLSGQGDRGAQAAALHDGA